MRPDVCIGVIGLLRNAPKAVIFTTRFSDTGHVPKKGVIPNDV